MSRINRHAIVIIAVAAVVMRGGIVLLRAGPGPELPDEIQYWATATRLADGAGLSDELGFRATRMPLFPTLLAPFTRLQGGWTFALLGLALISAGATLFTGALAFRALRPACRSHVDGLDVRVTACVAAALVAMDPFLAYLARFSLTENLYCTALVMWLAVGWPLATAARPSVARWAACAVCVVLCVYSRPSLQWHSYRCGRCGSCGAARAGGPR